jgi:hypothetical protein
MEHTGFQNRPMPVLWHRHFILLKGFGMVLVDQLESSGEHDYTWLFHLLPCSPIVNKESKSVFTGFSENNLMLLPVDSNLLSGPELGPGTMSRQAQVLTNPVAKYEVRAANISQAFLLLPVRGERSPITQLSQRVQGKTIEIDIAGAFGRRRLKIVQSDGASKPRHTLSFDTNH